MEKELYHYGFKLSCSKVFFRVSNFYAVFLCQNERELPRLLLNFEILASLPFTKKIAARESWLIGHSGIKTSINVMMIVPI